MIASCVPGFGSSTSGLGLRVLGFRIRFPISRFHFGGGSGFGFRVSGFGIRVLDLLALAELGREGFRFRFPVFRFQYLEFVGFRVPGLRSAVFRWTFSLSLSLAASFSISARSAATVSLSSSSVFVTSTCRSQFQKNYFTEM